MDIRECFLDCAGLENASQGPPTPLPEVGTQTAAVNTPPEAPISPTQPVTTVHATSPGANSRRPSLKALAQVSSAFSAAKVGTSRMGASLSAKGRSLGKRTTSVGAGAEKIDGSGQGGEDVASERCMAKSGVTMSMPGLFKRASRTATEEQQLSGSGKPSTKQTSSLSPRGNSSNGGKDGHSWSGGNEASQSSAVKVGVVIGGGGDGTSNSERPRNEERERSDLFGGSSRSPSTSPRATKTKSPSAAAWRGSTNSGMSSHADRGSTRGAVGVNCSAEESKNRNSAAASATASASSLPVASAGSGDRKEKRAFAGGLWNGGGNNSGAAGVRGSSEPATEQLSKNGPVGTNDEVVAVAATSHSTECGIDGGETGSVSFSSGPATKRKPFGGKRRFAGGGLSGPPQPAPAQPITTPSGAVQSDNPFVSAGSGFSGYGDGVVSRTASGRAGAPHGSSFAAGETTLVRGETRNVVAKSQDAAEASVPAWASESVPGWVTESEGGGGDKNTPGGGSGNAFPPSNGPGLAPPSGPEQGQQVAANNSPFMKVDPQASPARRPSQTRPGESGGSRRAFGGGERLF